MQSEEERLKGVANEFLDILKDVAPHRTPELLALLEEHSIRFAAVEEQHESPFIVIPAEGVIRAHMPAIKRQLVMAFAYVIAYRELVRDPSINGRYLNVADTPKAEKAKEMLRWAMLERYQVAMAKERGSEPPNDRVAGEDWFPEGWIDGTDDRIALGVFYTAMVADLHHEIAHLTKRHTLDGDVDPIAQEIEADREAAQWLVGHLADGDRYFNGSMLGLALSQTYEVFLTLEGFKSDPLHPPIVGRLRDAISPWIKNDDHPVWAFVGTVLRLHLSLANIPPKFDETRSFTSFREMAEYLMEIYESKNS